MFYIARYRWTGRYEAHLRENSCRREDILGKEDKLQICNYHLARGFLINLLELAVYLVNIIGGYDKEDLSRSPGIIGMRMLKPVLKEFTKVAVGTTIVFVLMGFQRFLREADLHSHQRHRRCYLGDDYFIYSCWLGCSKSDFSLIDSSRNNFTVLGFGLWSLWDTFRGGEAEELAES